MDSEARKESNCNARERAPMTDDEKEAFADLKAEVKGLRQVLAIALNLLPREIVSERLTAIEKMWRVQNMSSGAIEVVRSFREIWDK
jgi:hypothetical protein